MQTLWCILGTLMRKGCFSEKSVLFDFVLAPPLISFPKKDRDIYSGLLHLPSVSEPHEGFEDDVDTDFRPPDETLR